MPVKKFKEPDPPDMIGTILDIPVYVDTRTAERLREMMQRSPRAVSVALVGARAGKDAAAAFLVARVEFDQRKTRGWQG